MGPLDKLERERARLRYELQQLRGWAAEIVAERDRLRQRIGVLEAEREALAREEVA